MKKDIQVSGHIEAIKGVYHMKISWVQDGKRHRKSKSTGLIERGNKKRAQDMLVDFIRHQQAELVAKGDSSKDILFTDYMEEWLAKAKTQIRATTYSGYKDNIYNVIIPYFKPFNLKLSEITPKHIQDFYTKQSGRVKGTTVRKYHANIHKAIKDARRLKLIEENPMEFVDPPKTVPFHGSPYNVDEVKKILTLISDTIYEIPITMMLFYGLRREEAIGLKWSNIDFENNSILIGHTVTETSVDGRLQMIKEDLMKNASSYRTLPLSLPVRALLEEKKESIYEYRKLFKKGYYYEDSDYVCVNEIGELIKPRTLSDNFKRIIRKNNIRDFRLYDCRHTAASLMLKNGVHMKHIQAVMGHSDFGTTANTYSHLEYSDTVAAMEKMNEIIFGEENEEIQGK